jgi:hypothetical protein
MQGQSEGVNAPLFMGWCVTIELTHLRFVSLVPVSKTACKQTKAIMEEKMRYISFKSAIAIAGFTLISSPILGVTANAQDQKSAAVGRLPGPFGGLAISDRPNNICPGCKPPIIDIDPKSAVYPPFNVEDIKRPLINRIEFPDYSDVGIGGNITKDRARKVAESLSAKFPDGLSKVPMTDFARALLEFQNSDPRMQIYIALPIVGPDGKIEPGPIALICCDTHMVNRLSMTTTIRK